MSAANRFNLASNHLQIGEMIVPEEKDEHKLEGAFHKFPSEFYEFRPFKMVADLSYSHEFILRPKVSTLVSLVDYQDKDRQITRDVPNFVDGNFHTTCTRGFGGYGDEMYLAVPSYNPDPRIRLPIPGEHVINGERVFERHIKQKTLVDLYELGLYDSEAPIILHGIVCRGDFSQVLIVVTNTGSEDFALADLARLTFTVELFHSMPVRGGSPYNLTMLRSYFIHEVKNSPTGTDEEEESHGDDIGEDMEEA
jgi:hypothetical protein